jgi:branched-chain amino acid transport system permease protein
MQAFILAAKLGLSAGALDALLAFGIVLIYRTTGVLNFAQAATGAVATYAAFSVSQGRPLWLAVLAGLGMGGGLGGATYWAVGGIRSRHYALATAVATLAVAILLQQVIGIFWTNTQGQFPDPLPFSSGIDIGGVPIDWSTIARLAVASALALGIGAYLRWSRNGTMVRAAADNPSAARLCGGNVRLLLTGVWTVAGMLTAIAGMFVGQAGLTPNFLDPFLIAAVIAAVLGGLRSLTGAFLGALGLEVARTLFVYYEPQHLPDVTMYTQTFVIVVLILVLLLAPRRWLARGADRQV